MESNLLKNFISHEFNEILGNICSLCKKEIQSFEKIYKKIQDELISNYI